MPLISIGNLVTNVDEDSQIKMKLDEINAIIPYEIVVIREDWKEGFLFKKDVSWFSVHHKRSEMESEQLTPRLTEKEAEWFIEGLILAWQNPIRNLRRVK